jgi:SseB protein N-terminal domain
MRARRPSRPRRPNYSGPVLGLSNEEHRFGADGGAADPRAAAALAAFASGSGTEHAALTSLASVRLLVPVVATLAAVAVDCAPGGDKAAGGNCAPGGDNAACGDHAAAGDRAEKASEMSIPTLVGHDGRPAVPAFTCLDALVRWRPNARPVPVEAGSVWLSAVADSCAVVLDIAGPVPLAIDGARLAALANGQPVPLPHEDPDVLAELTAVVAGQPAVDRARLADGGSDGDLVIELAFSPGHAESAGELARLVGSALLVRLGGRLRRGIKVVISSPSSAGA